VISMALEHFRNLLDAIKSKWGTDTAITSNNMDTPLIEGQIASPPPFQHSIHLQWSQIISIYKEKSVINVKKSPPHW